MESTLSINYSLFSHFRSIHMLGFQSGDERSFTNNYWPVPNLNECKYTSNGVFFLTLQSYVLSGPRSFKIQDIWQPNLTKTCACMCLQNIYIPVEHQKTYKMQSLRNLIYQVLLKNVWKWPHFFEVFEIQRNTCSHLETVKDWEMT